ncbi:bacteriophytochrome (light-regulated signal transduction histidine kinase) [Burkholderiales bacterium JOSHI_001]|nr:bacteriophytochrome (light-regulated signal transduction histidine kinase) [Burkholderiales bacterium JOSHI_001]
MAEPSAWFETGRVPLPPDPQVALAPRLSRPVGLAILALAYALAAGLSVAISRQSGSVATVWFANALVVGLLMHRTPRDWALRLAVVALANLAVNVAWGDGLANALAFLPANLLEMALGAWLLRRWNLHRTGLRSPVLLLRLLLGGGVLPQVVGATLGAAVIAARGVAPFGTVWLAWFEGSVIGALSVLPVVVCAMRHRWSSIRQQVMVAHMAWLAPLALGVTVLSLAHVPFPFVYLSIPLLVAAMLVEFLPVALLTLGVSLTVALVLGLGILVPPPTTADWQQVYVYMAYAAALVPAQLLAAAVAELRDQHTSLLARSADLARANQGLEQFVRIASHDLREPLNTIVQFSGLIEQDHGALLPPDGQQFLGLVRRAALRMRGLLDDMLHYTRLQRSQVDLVLAPVALDEVLDKVRQDLAARLRERDAVLTLEPLPTVLGQASLLELLFGNLLGNALKFVPAGRQPQVRLSALVQREQVVVVVQDNGIGIAPEDLSKLFKPFSRLHLRRDYEGTGLGLALAQQVAQGCGGRIEVSSVPGQGSRFSVWLKAVPVA